MIESKWVSFKCFEITLQFYELTVWTWWQNYPPLLKNVQTEFWKKNLWVISNYLHPSHQIWSLLDVKQKYSTKKKYRRHLRPLLCEDYYFMFKHLPPIRSHRSFVFHFAFLFYLEYLPCGKAKNISSSDYSGIVWVTWMVDKSQRWIETNSNPSNLNQCNPSYF